MIIAAVRWRELIVPFSSFVARTSAAVEGFSLTIDNTGSPQAVERVEPLVLNFDRVFAPWHELNFYVDENSLEKGVKTYEAACDSKGIGSFVLVELEPPFAAPEGLASPKQNTMRGVIGEMAKVMGEIPRNEDPPLYKHILYFGMQQLSQSEYLCILQSEPSVFADMQEYVNEMEEEEALCTLHEAVNDLEPRPHRDFFEIGYPAKLQSRLLDEEAWRIKRVRRYGSFSRNSLLRDETIIDELSGTQGNTQQKYVKIFNTTDKTQLAQIRKGVKECLKDNLAWRRQILVIIDELESEGAATDARISIYNPSSGLLTCYMAATDDRGALYVPSYSILIDPDEPSRMYFGSLSGDGSSPDFDAVLSEFYGGDLGQLMLPLTWGGYEARDSEIMRKLGLRYRTFRADIEGEERIFFKLVDDGWEHCEPINPIEGFFRFLTENNEFTDRVVEEYSSLWDGTVVILDGSDCGPD